MQMIYKFLNGEEATVPDVNHSAGDGDFISLIRKLKEDDREIQITLQNGETVKRKGSQLAAIEFRF